MEIRLSIIIPVYNVAEYLERCLDAILGQDYDSYEILLIDDGSTDQSGSICRTYSHRYPQVKYFYQKNSGVAQARNSGLNLASGDYFFFCDPDDYLTGEFFKSVDNHLKGKPDLLIYGYCDEVEINGKIVDQVFHLPERTACLDREGFRQAFSDLYLNNLLYTLWNKVYSRQFLEDHKLRFQTVRSGEDVRFNLEAAPALSRVVLVKEAYYHYIINRSGSLTNAYDESFLTDKLGEWEELRKVLGEIGQSDSRLLDKEKNDIFLSVVHHIILSDLSTDTKSRLIKELSERPEFDDLSTDFGLVNKIIIWMLRHGLIRPYIWFYSWYTRRRKKQGEKWKN